MAAMAGDAVIQSLIGNTDGISVSHICLAAAAAASATSMAITPVILKAMSAGRQAAAAATVALKHDRTFDQSAHRLAGYVAIDIAVHGGSSFSCMKCLLLYEVQSCETGPLLFVTAGLTMTGDQLSGLVLGSKAGTVVGDWCNNEDFHFLAVAAAVTATTTTIQLHHIHQMAVKTGGKHANTEQELAARTQAQATCLCAFKLIGKGGHMHTLVDIVWGLNYAPTANALQPRMPRTSE